MRHLLRIAGLFHYAILVMAIGFAATAMTGCAHRQPLVVEKPIPVDKLVFVPIDPALTATKPIPAPRDNSGAELLRVARERKTDLILCYGKLDAIQSVQGTAAPTP